MRAAFISMSMPLLLLTAAAAEDPVDFPDMNLKAAVEAALWKPDPTPTDMLGLTELTCIGSKYRDNPILSLAGLEYALNLQSLTLRYHLIGDISPLSGLTNLQTLDLLGNEITSLSPLGDLIDLQTLNLERNCVSDISTLSVLTELHTLSLHRNQVSDISPLSDLTSLGWFDLRINPLNQEAYDTYIDQIIANNPGMWFAYDPHFYRRVILESTRGGSITMPGEGGFAYEFGEEIWLKAEADPCFVFARWSGSYGSSEELTYLLVDQDYEITANFVSALDTIYVDNDGPNDPAPGDLAVRDAHENGSVEHPFDRIQEAIDVAAPGARVLVHPGAYHENINLLGKRIELTGIDPNAPSAADYPVLTGLGAGPVVSFVGGEDPNCKLTGFVITGGRSQPATALYCLRSSPTIANCLIIGNRSTDPNGAAICCADSNAVFVNCTIADNYAGEYGAGIRLVDSDVTLLNSIVWGNVPQGIAVEGGSQPSIRHTDITGGWPGAGNIDNNPMFASPGGWVDRENPNVVVAPSNPGVVWADGDYHLKSQTGRWDPKASVWVQDEGTSPCIDAGDPSSPLGTEPEPNGAIVNIGGYGATNQAAKSQAGN